MNPNKTTFGGTAHHLATLSLSSENLLLLVLQFVMVVRAPVHSPAQLGVTLAPQGEAPLALRGPLVS